jgi:hypothetical protein
VLTMWARRLRLPHVSSVPPPRIPGPTREGIRRSGVYVETNLEDAPQWKHSMFNSLTDLCWARVVQAPDDTEHLWRGLLPGDVSLYIPPNVLETPIIDSEKQLRQLRRDIKNFLQPLADAMQDMLSTRGRLYHSALPLTPAPSTRAAARLRYHEDTSDSEVKTLCFREEKEKRISPPKDLGWHNRAKGSYGRNKVACTYAARISLEQRNGSCHFPPSGQS